MSFFSRICSDGTIADMTAGQTGALMDYTIYMSWCTCDGVEYSFPPNHARVSVILDNKHQSGIAPDKFQVTLRNWLKKNKDIAIKF